MHKNDTNNNTSSIGKEKLYSRRCVIPDTVTANLKVRFTTTSTTTTATVDSLDVVQPCVPTATLPSISFLAKVPSPSCDTPDSPESATIYDDSFGTLPNCLVKEEPEDRLTQDPNADLADLDNIDLLPMDDINLEALADIESFDNASNSSGSHLDFACPRDIPIFSNLGVVPWEEDYNMMYNRDIRLSE